MWTQLTCRSGFRDARAAKVLVIEQEAEAVYEQEAEVEVHTVRAN